MSYSHASELSRFVPPAQQLDYLVRQLGVWADLNPSLRSLHSEFERVSREVTQAQGTDAAARQIVPYDVEIGRPGADARMLTEIRALLYERDDGG
jgi:hypothetical protein